jgi:hypothetical protein
MALHQKRSAYQAQLNNSESIGAGQTIIPAIIKNIKKGTTSKGNKYYRISASSIAKDKIFVKMKTKQKKQKVSDEEANTDATGEDTENVETADTVGELPKGTTISPNEQFMTTAYDTIAETLEQGNVVKLAVTTDWYIDHFTFQTSKIMVDEKHKDVLNVNVYTKCIEDSPLGELPTKDNFSPDNFPVGTDEKYITRSCVVPLSDDIGKKQFSNVELQVDLTDKERFNTRNKNDPNLYIGINTDLGGEKPANMTTAVYTRNNEEQTKVLMRFAYKPEVWDCFGVKNQEQWKEVGPRYVCHAVEWLVYAYAQHSKIMAIKANMEGGNDTFEDEDQDSDSVSPEEFQYSTAFVTKMSVNMKETARKCGIPLSIDYINKFYGEESDYDNDVEYSDHKFNTGWKTLLKRNKPFFVTLTDLSSDQIATFIKEYNKIDPEKNSIQFFGVYSVDSDVPYEIQGTDEEREQQLIEQGFRPTMVFALNK